MPVVAKKKKKSALISNGSTKPKRAMVEDEEEEEEEAEPVEKKKERKKPGPKGSPTAALTRAEAKEFYNLKFEIKGTKFVLTGNFDARGHDSTTKRSDVHATTCGLWDTGVKLHGASIIVGFNCFTSKAQKSAMRSGDKERIEKNLKKSRYH